ncbi:hypothetical protein GXB80_26065 [Paenibacillus polymyxa]|nr:hypothetical protein [Paenibacillus polymyxa]
MSQLPIIALDHPLAYRSVSLLAKDTPAGFNQPLGFQPAHKKGCSWIDPETPFIVTHYLLL